MDFTRFFCAFLGGVRTVRQEGKGKTESDSESIPYLDLPSTYRKTSHHNHIPREEPARMTLMPQLARGAFVFRDTGYTACVL